MAPLRSLPRVATAAVRRLPGALDAWRGEYPYAASDYVSWILRGDAPGRMRDLPEVEVLGEDEDGFVRLAIGGEVYHWPADAERSGLPWIHQEVFAPARMNPHAYEWAGVSIRPGDRVVDAGAAEGFFTRYAVSRGATVLAAEPLPVLAEGLRRTFAEEIAQGRVTVLEAALSSSPGVAHLEPGPTIFEGSLGGSGCAIELMRLDDLMGRFPADLVKMDIEGAEVEAVEGALGYITAEKPRLAIAVYHAPENAREIVRLLRSARPDYQTTYRGIFAPAGEAPRPFMVLAW